VQAAHEAGQRRLYSRTGEDIAAAFPDVIAGLNFDGVGVGFTGPAGAFTPDAAPPDTNGAVGTTQYVQWVNESFAVFDKSTGALAAGSGEIESFSTELGGGLEYPHYTRPAEFRGWHVPDVLLSGDHGNVDRWRKDHVR